MRRWAVLGLSVGVAWSTVTVPLSFDPSSFFVQTHRETLRVSGPGGSAILDIPGTVALPTLAIHLLLPQGEKATRVAVEIHETIPLGSGVLPSVQWNPPPGVDTFMGSLPKESEPIKSGPKSPLQGFVNGWMAGYPIVGVLIRPFVYDSATRRLSLITHMDLKVETGDGMPPTRFPIQADPWAWSVLKQRLQHLVANPEQVSLLRPPQSIRTADPTALNPSPTNPFPTPATGPYPLLILTDSTLLEPFQAYATWHTLHGRPSAVFTFSWIESHFAGSDRAERVRNFLQEAFLAWGVQWVLLAGDAPLAPVRTFYQNPYWGSPSDQYPPTDLYFACLDGTWDRDGDHIYGEVEDSVDALPEFYVGRIPVETPEQAWAFVQKAMTYATSPADSGYPKRALALGTDLWGNNEGSLYAEQVVSNSWPSTLDIIRMYETDTTQNTLDAFLTILNNGVGLLYINAHAFYHFFMINSNPPVWFGFSEIPLLANAGRYPFVNIVACDVGGWDLHAIMEPWLRSPEKGAVGILTVTRLDFPDEEVPFNIATYQTIFDSALAQPQEGDAFYAQTQFWPYTAYYSLTRYIYLSKVLLGDPALPVWTDSLHTLWVEHPDTLQVGSQTITVQVRDAGTTLPIAGARVVAYKAGEVYVPAETDANGVVSLTLHPLTAGPLILSVQARNAPWRSDTLWVVPGPFAPRFMILGFQDERGGDGDGNADVGEYGSLWVQMTNEGAEPGTGVWVRWLFPEDGLHTIPMTPSFVVLPPGSTTTPFSIPLRIDVDVPPGAHSILLYSGESEGGVPPPFLTPDTPADTLYLQIHAPSLDIVRIVHRLRGDTLYLWPDLWNIGTDEARSIRIWIHPGSEVLEALDTLYDPVVTLAPGTGYFDTTDAPLVLRVSPDQLAETHETWFLQEARGIVDTFVLWNAEVPPISNLQAQPLLYGVRLTWARGPSHAGFLVFRRIGNTGPMERLTATPIPTARYEDSESPSGPPLTYWVIAVDTLGNSSEPSESLTTYAGLPVANGWPQVYGMGGESHHPTVADLAPETPGLEIAFGSVTGWIYLYHADGTLAEGWPVHVDGEVWNTPAAGDLDGDGSPELVVAPFRGDTWPNRVYAFEADGTPVPGWPVDYNPGSGRGSYAPPLVGDLDGDGTPEVFVHHVLGKVFAWQADGSSYLPGTDGYFADAGVGFNSGYLAMADVDQDGIRELLCVSNDPNQTLMAWDPQGNPKPGFPLALGARAQGGIAIGDLDPSVPGLEIAFVRSDTQKLYVVDATGNVLPGWPVTLSGNGAIYTQPSLGDVDGDGALELLVNDDSGVLAFHADGILAQTFPFDDPLGQIFSQPIAVDINGDGTDEVFCAYREGLLYGWHSDGSPLPGLPLFLAEELKTTPAVVDLNDDQTLELVVLGTDRLTVFTLPGSQRPVQTSWPMHAHDPGNTSTVVAGNPKTLSISAPQLPRSLTFLPPRPNPTPTVARLHLGLPYPQRISLEVFDVSGRRLATLAHGRYPAGWYVWTWPASRTPRPSSGLYFIRLETPTLQKTYPLVLTR